MGDDVGELIGHLGLDKADVVGYSLGADVALRAAIQHPDRVRRLVLLSTPYARFGWYPEVLEGMAQVTSKMADQLLGTPPGAATRDWPQPGRFPHFLDKLGAVLSEDYDWSPEVRRLRMPVMLVYADHDSISTRHIAEFYALLGGGLEDPGWRRRIQSFAMSRGLLSSWTLNRRSRAWSRARCARWQNGQHALAPRAWKRLAGQPVAEATRRVDRPLGDFGGDAQSLTELAVGEESKRRNEHLGEAGRGAVVDVDISDEFGIDQRRLRVKVEHGERAAADRAEKRAGVLALGQHDDTPRLASEHPGQAAGAVTIARQIAIVIEHLNLVAPELSETCRGGGDFWSVQERDIDIERGMRGTAVHRAAQGRLVPEAFDRGRHIGWEPVARAEQRRPGLWRRSTAATTSEAQDSRGDGDEHQCLATRRHPPLPSGRS